jgi:beta-lactamase regulating signal transducer with metallopeptidase domain
VDTLLHAALSNAAVAVVLAVIVTVFGRISRRPALVHSLWLIVLLKLLTPPLWPVSVSWLIRSQEGQVTADSFALEPSVHPEPGDPVARVTLGEEKADGVPDETAASSARAAALPGPSPLSLKAPPAAIPPSPPEPLNPAAAATFSAPSLQAWLVTIWLSGSAWWLALAGYRIYRFHRLLRYTQPAPAKVQERARRLAKRVGLGRCPGIWVVPAPVSPLLWALAGEARLLVPASLLERLTAEQWDTLLAHELAHLRRRDHWVRILELACLALYWWYPAVWWARRELREVEEQCCDAWVVWALPGAAGTYATALVEAVTYLSGARCALPLAASGIGPMRLLKRRLNMIMRGTTPRSLSAAGSLAVLCLAAILLPLCPTLARTEQRFGTGNEQAGGGTPTSGGRFERGADTAEPVAGADAQEQPASGTPAGGASGGSSAGPRSRSSPFGGTTVEERMYPETVEDAQDEVDLLRVQLELRQAERREAQARLGAAKREQTRLSSLAAQGGVSTDLVERANTELEIQEARLHGKDAQIKEAELRLKQAQRRLARLREQEPRNRERRQGAMGGASGAIAGSRRYGSGGQPLPGGGGTIPPPVSGPGTGFSGGTSFTGGISHGISGGLGGGVGGIGGFSGMGPGFGNVSAYEHRLAEVEKKLQALIVEVTALRQEHRPEKSPAKP